MKSLMFHKIVKWSSFYSLHSWLLSFDPLSKTAIFRLLNIFRTHFQGTQATKNGEFFEGLKKQARKGFRPPSAMKGMGYFQNLRNLLKDFFWRNFLGEIFWRIFFGRIFLGGFFGRIFWVDFLGGILWEEFN